MKVLGDLETGDTFAASRSCDPEERLREELEKGVERKTAAELFYLLVLLCTGKALTVVRSVEASNGLEAPIGICERTAYALWQFVFYRHSGINSRKAG